MQTTNSMGQLRRIETGHVYPCATGAALIARDGGDHVHSTQVSVLCRRECLGNI